MFKIEAQPTFWWKIDFLQPNAAGTGHDKQSFMAKFKRLDSDAFLDRAKKVSECEQSDAVKAYGAIREAMRDVLIDFKEIEFEGEKSAVIEYLLRDLTISKALYLGYTSAILGRELTEGN